MRSPSRLNYSWIMASAVSICLPLITATKGYAARLANVTFEPDINLINDRTGTVRASATATVDPGTGSVAIETNNPFMYFNPSEPPDPAVDFPCGIGTPGAIAGVTGSVAFNFGNGAQCTEGVGFYSFFYEARVTNNEGSFPNPPDFQALEPEEGNVFQIVSGNYDFSPTPVATAALVAESSTDTTWGGNSSTDTMPEHKSVPEPKPIVGLVFVGLISLSRKMKDR